MRKKGSKNIKCVSYADKCIKSIQGILDTIIDKNMLKFRVSALENPECVDFSVKNTKYGYDGYNHWILDHIEGTYDESLWSLLHWILYQEKYYRKILSPEQLINCQKLLQDDNAALYLPCIEDEIDYVRLETIDK